MEQRLTRTIAGMLVAGALAGPPAAAWADAEWGARGDALGALGLAISRLDLSDTQQQQIRALLRDRRGELEAAADRLAGARRHLRDAIGTEPVNEGLIRQRAAEVAEAAADLAVTRAHLGVEVRAVLTPAQRQEAAAMRERFERWLLASRTAVRAFFGTLLEE